MDVTLWNLASRMKLPDHCFGNRQAISVQIKAVGVGAMDWRISTVVLPDPICIWEVGILPLTLDTSKAYIRVGLLDNLPGNEAAMNLAVPILPNFGNIGFTPPRIAMADAGYNTFQFVLRKGIVTGGKKVAVECYSDAVELKVQFYLVFSELPNLIPGWPGAWPAG